MNSAVDFLNNLTGFLVRVLIEPLSGISAVWSLTVVSILVGLFFLFIFGKISNQNRLRAVKRAIAASFLEAIIFRHDFGTSLRAQGAMLLGGCKYFMLAVPPLLVLLIPSLFILGQLNLRYGYKPLELGEHSILGVQLRDDSQLYRVSLINPPEGLEITPPLRIKSSKEVLWRVTPTAPGDKKLVIKLGDSGQELQAEIKVAGSAPLPEITAHNDTSWWWKVLYPGTALNKVEDSVQQQWISYPEQELSFAGMHTHWIIVFAIVSILAGLAGSRVFRIEV